MHTTEFKKSLNKFQKTYFAQTNRRWKLYLQQKQFITQIDLSLVFNCIHHIILGLLFVTLSIACWEFYLVNKKSKDVTNSTNNSNPFYYFF